MQIFFIMKGFFTSLNLIFDCLTGDDVNKNGFECFCLWEPILISIDSFILLVFEVSCNLKFYYQKLDWMLRYFVINFVFLNFLIHFSTWICQVFVLAFNFISKAHSPDHKNFTLKYVWLWEFQFFTGWIFKCLCIFPILFEDLRFFLQ